ncbi:unnamed protein product [Bemisia tabaci]|uniref:Phosphomannomutase n=1 Tax=Bemisia tabaci TaxID=7038 RepID=A0A9P0AB07_BEMTA|nr:unnamed protein product [Bemisia tabaci]
MLPVVLSHCLKMSRKLCLFDIDGTLTSPRKKITPEVLSFLLEKVKPVSAIALVGGSDLSKASEQMGGDEILKQFDFVFTENGLMGFKNGEKFHEQTIVKHLGEEKLQQFINFALKYMSQITLPFKRGTFIEFRTGMLNISPAGRSVTQAQRDAYEEYDKEHKIREKFIQAIKESLPDLGLTYSIGGQISFDVFPTGWDKTYCLQFLDDFAERIHFFGDKTSPGGNDHEIFSDSRTIGHTVTSYEDTIAQLKKILDIP